MCDGSSDSSSRTDARRQFPRKSIGQKFCFLSLRIHRPEPTLMVSFHGTYLPIVDWREGSSESFPKKMIQQKSLGARKRATTCQMAPRSLWQVGLPQTSFGGPDDGQRVTERFFGISRELRDRLTGFHGFGRRSMIIICPSGLVVV